MAASQRIRYGEVRRIHELVGRIVECGHDPSLWRPMALEGLKNLIGGQVGLTLDMRLTPSGVPRMIDPVDVGWQTDSVRRRYHQYVASGEMAADPGTIAWMAAQRDRRHVCLTRRELVDDATWYGAPAVSEARRMGDVDDFVLSTVALGSDAVHGFIIYRSWSERPFEPPYRRITKLFHLALARASRVPGAAAAPGGAAPSLPPGPRLSPRLRQTLELLMTPLTLKEIAARLGLSRHTVNDYQKALYTRFGVSSRIELLHRRPAEAGPAGIQLPAGLLAPRAPLIPPVPGAARPDEGAGRRTRARTHDGEGRARFGHVR